MNEYLRKDGQSITIKVSLKNERNSGIYSFTFHGKVVQYMWHICVLCAPIDSRGTGAASRGGIKNYGDWYTAPRIYVYNEADNKTPREFFRITSGLLVRYTRRSCMTRQKCPSGAHGRGENERGSPWYIAGLEKWFRRRGNRETPKCSLRFGWRRIAFPRVGYWHAYAHTCIQIGCLAKWIWIARVIQVRLADLHTTSYAKQKPVFRASDRDYRES